MSLSHFIKVLRWFLVPLCAVAGYIEAFFVAIPVNQAIHSYLWSHGHAMPGKEFLTFVEPYDGAIAAFLVVVCGTFFAPARRVYTALALLVLGGIVAWQMVGESYSSVKSAAEFHEAPIRLWWPIIGTCLGGFTGFLAIYLTTRARSPRFLSVHP